MQWTIRRFLLAVAACAALSIVLLTTKQSIAVDVPVTIYEVTAGTGTDNFFPGQALTTPAGGPWNHLTFNWFSAQVFTEPTAFGTLFMLSQEYPGTPGAMSTFMPGFLAASQSIAAGQYVFDPAVTISPNTRYYFYTNAAGPLSGGVDDAGAVFYVTRSGGTSFEPAPTVDANFRLSGQVVPEPGAWLLAILAGGQAGLAARRGRKQLRPARSKSGPRL